MALKFVVSQESTGDDLPWINEFLEANPEKEGKYVSAIQEFILVQKGIMVIALDYKGFLFKDSKLYSFLTEAIAYWKLDPKNAQINGLFFTAHSKPNIAIDEEITDVTVVFESKKKISLRWGNKTKKSIGENGDVNPFIPKAKK